MYRDSDLLILDDVLSAVDHHTEAQLVETVADLTRRPEAPTVLIASHRLSALRHCDTVLVLDGGRLVDQRHPQRADQAAGDLSRHLAGPEPTRGLRGRGGVVKKRSVLRRLWPYLRPDAWAFALALALTPVTAGLSLVQPWILKKVIDEHLVPGVADGLMALALVYLGAVVAGYLLEGGYVLSLAWGGQRSIVRLRSGIYRKLLGLRQSYLDRQPAGKLLTRATSDVDALGEALSSGLINIILDLLMIVGTLVAMFLLDARLTLVLLLLAPPILAILEFIRRRLRVLFVEVREALASVNAFLAERVDGVEVVQLFGNEAHSESLFDERNHRFRARHHPFQRLRLAACTRWSTARPRSASRSCCGTARGSRPAWACRCRCRDAGECRAAGGLHRVPRSSVPAACVSSPPRSRSCSGARRRSRRSCRCSMSTETVSDEGRGDDRRWRARS